jgi:nickel-dependent lactate racemase
MKIKIPYGYNEETVNVDDGVRLEVVEPNENTVGDADAIIGKALASPIDSPSLGEFVAGSGDTWVIVNDGTRPTPTAKVLAAIYPVIKDTPVRFMVATGTHREPTEEELDRIFGDLHQEFKERIFFHDSRNGEEMLPLRDTSRGTPVSFNKHIMQAERIIAVNSVEPHYFAGYTGGRKSFLPGVAGYETIEHNHSHALKPGVAPTALQGNAVSEDMAEAAAMIDAKKIFGIQIVLDQKKRVFGAACGHIETSFLQAAKLANQVFGVKVEGKADIVLTLVRPPKDINLYQAQHALENAKLALNKDGAVIWVCACHEGIGPSKFFDLMSECSSPQEVKQKVAANYKLGYHKASLIADTTQWAHCLAVTGLPDEDIDKIFFKQYPTIQAAIDKAVEIKGKSARMLVLMDGTLTVPLL